MIILIHKLQFIPSFYNFFHFILTLWDKYGIYYHPILQMTWRSEKSLCDLSREHKEEGVEVKQIFWHHIVRSFILSPIQQTSE